MKYLVGDIGNTFIKLSILNERFEISKEYNLETSKIFIKKNRDKFLSNIKKTKLKKQVLFSSVVPKAFKVIKNILSKKKFKVKEIKNLKIKKILKIKVKNYNQLGSDRISNALGALKFKNSLIIDFGTATTFDIVKNRVYEGGIISPGVKLSILNLHKSTALLPMINLKKFKNNFGKNTKEAINAGFFWGYEGLINNIIKKISFKTKTNYKIILTGGYAKLFSKYVHQKSIIDENITIKGISKAYRELL